MNGTWGNKHRDGCCLICFKRQCHQVLHRFQCRTRPSDNNWQADKAIHPPLPDASRWGAMLSPLCLLQGRAGRLPKQNCERTSSNFACPQDFDKIPLRNPGQTFGDQRSLPLISRFLSRISVPPDHPGRTDEKRFEKLDVTLHFIIVKHVKVFSFFFI